MTLWSPPSRVRRSAMSASRVRLQHHRHDDAADLVRVLPHDAPDSLGDVNLAVAGVEEDDGVQCGHVHTLGEQAYVGHDPAFAVLGGVVQAFQLPAAFPSVVLGLQMRRRHVQRPALAVLVADAAGDGGLQAVVG